MNVCLSKTYHFAFTQNGRQLYGPRYFQNHFFGMMELKTDIAVETSTQISTITIAYFLNVLKIISL